METPLLQLIAEKLQAERVRQQRIAVSGCGSVAALKVVKAITTEQLRLETGFTARGWRGALR